MQARGEAVRADDNAEIAAKRLTAYHAQTAPLSAYYRQKGLHKATDGMAPIDEVTVAIGQLLAPSPRKKAVSARKRAVRGTAGRRPAGRKPAKGARQARRRPKTVSKSAKKAKKTAKGRTRKSSATARSGKTGKATTKAANQGLDRTPQGSEEPEIQPEPG